jgi:hypothetical protein
MSITQFNATYVQEEDRVMFRFNTSASQEYRLWFTRLVVRDLLRLIDQGSVQVLAREHPVEQAKAIAEFKQQAKAANPQFTTFVPATQFPLGADPVLVHGMRMTVQPDHTALELLIPKGQVLTMRLTEDMLGQVRLLLQTIEKRAEWGLMTAVVPQALAGDAPAPAVKLGTEPEADANADANTSSAQPKKLLH